MNAWDILVPVFTGLGMGQLIRYLMARTGEKAFTRKILLQAAVIGIAMVVLIALGARSLSWSKDQRNMLLSAVWLGVFALLFWRTKALEAAQKA